eukprot:jgi/Tetstr1/444634/TSEL_032482.t1
MAQDAALEPAANQHGLGLVDSASATPPQDASGSPLAESVEPAPVQAALSDVETQTMTNTPPFRLTASSTEADLGGLSSKTHHLLKHQLPSGDMTHHFGSSDPKVIFKFITKMGQRELQAKFRDVFQTPTFSNNNNWLRRKLMEAAGLQAPKLQGKAKTGGSKRGGARKPKGAPKKNATAPGPRRVSIKAGKRAAAPAEAMEVDSPDKKRRSARRLAKIQEGELVWAKLKSQGYWPGQVANPANAFILEAPPSPDHLLVRFFDDSHSWVSPCEVLDLIQNWDRLSTSKSTPAFLQAVARAQQLLQLRQKGSWSEMPGFGGTPAGDTKMGPPPAHPHTHFYSDSDGCTSTHHSPLIHPSYPVNDLLTPNQLSHHCESQLVPAETPLSMWDADGPSLGFLMSSSNMLVDDFSLPCDTKATPPASYTGSHQHVALPPLSLPL